MAARVLHAIAAFRRGATSDWVRALAAPAAEAVETNPVPEVVLGRFSRRRNTHGQGQLVAPPSGMIHLGHGTEDI